MKKILAAIIGFFLCISLVYAEKTHLIWTGFSSGELSPLIDGQVNFDKYYQGAKTLENFLPRPQGPVSNRPGFRYIADTETHSQKSRLVPFIFSDTQAYVLEFGDQYIRFFRDGFQLTSLDAQNVLNLSMNGLDASTTFTDDSTTPHTMTAVSPGQIDTAEKKFGSGAGVFDGATSGVTTGDSSDWDLSASDGGIDVWVRPTVGNSGIYTIFRTDLDADSLVFQRLYLDKYTGLLLNGNGTDMSTTISDSSLNTKTLTRDGNTSLLLHGIDSNFAETNESIDIFDSSPTNHTANITVNGDAQISTAQAKFGGSSISFDGTGDYLTVTDHADFDLSGGAWTVEGWFRTSNNSSNQGIYSKSTDANNFMEIFLSNNGSFKTNIANTSEQKLLTSTSGYNDGSWHYFRVSESGGNYYIQVDNDVEFSEVVTQVVQAYTGDVKIGLIEHAKPTAVFDGYLDDIRIIKDVGLNGVSAPTTKRSAVEIDASDPMFGSGAIRFGGQDYITIPAHTDIDMSGDWEISFWYKTDTSASQLIMSRTTDANNYFYIYKRSDGKVGIVINDTSSAAELKLATEISADGNWHHYRFVCDTSGSNYYIFMDGDVSTVTDTIGNMGSTKNYSEDLYIGTSDSNITYSAFLEGQLDDVKFKKGGVKTSANPAAPVAEDKNIAHPVWEIGENTGTASTQKAEFEDDCITAESFHHVEADWDTSAKNLYLFCDGQLRNDGAVTFAGDTTNPPATDSLFSIGTDPDGSTLPYKGWMDELRFTNGTLRNTADFVPNTVEYVGLGTTPLEITENVSYVEADLFQLKFTQSTDTMYIAHPDYPPRKLLRLADTNWRLVDIEFLPPPLQSETRDASLELTLGQIGAGISVNATDASAAGTMFRAGDVGKEIREDNTAGEGRALIVTVADADTATVDIFKQFSSTTPDAGAWDIIGSNSIGTITISGNIGGGQIVDFGEVLTLTASVDVFTADTTTDVGKFITTDDGTGSIVYKIVSNTGSSTTVVQAAALSSDEYDANLVLIAGEWELKKSAWASNDYPITVNFFENRLLWAGSPSFPSTIWGSQVDDYENHDLDTADDSDAYAFTLAGNQVNKIRWIESSDVLLVGTNGGEWVLGSRGADTQTTPSNVTARSQTGHGSANVEAVNMGQSILFLQKGGEKVREMIFDFNIDRYQSPDMTILAEHITEGGIVEMDFQEDPVSTGWFVRSDGVLLSMTLLRNQEVIGWARHITDGTFESIAVIPGSDGDELWAIVNRTIGSATKRYVEQMQPLFDDTTLDSDQAFFVDSGLTYTGVSTTTITGLDHLDGETVSVLANGVVLGDEVVASGSITIDSAATRVIAGLPYTSKLQTMRPEVKDARGTIQGREKRVVRFVLRVDKTKQFQYGILPDDSDLQTETFSSLTSGDSDDLSFVMDNTQEGYISIVNAKPLPITVIAIIPDIDIPNY